MSSPLVRRVEVLEEKVNLLSELPGRVAAVETQLAALRGELTSFRGEVRDEFAAVRTEMRDGFAALRSGLRAEMGDGLAAVRSELSAQIRSGDEETRRYMRVLHEDVISRIALLQEGMDRSSARLRQLVRRGPETEDAVIRVSIPPSLSAPGVTRSAVFAHGFCHGRLSLLDSALGSETCCGSEQPSGAHTGNTDNG